MRTCLQVAFGTAFGSWLLLRRSQDLSSILACAYKRSRKHLDFPIENSEVRLSALTMRLRRVGIWRADLYHADLIGGKGGTRTLDPGIMSKAHPWHTQSGLDRFLAHANAGL